MVDWFDGQNNGNDTFDAYGAMRNPNIEFTSC